MNWTLLGQTTVVLCALLWRSIYKAGETTLFRIRLRRLLHAARQDWATGYSEWRSRQEA